MMNFKAVNTALMAGSIFAAAALVGSGASAAVVDTDTQTWNLNIGSSAPAFCAFSSIQSVELVYNAGANRFELGAQGDIIAQVGKIVNIRLVTDADVMLNGVSIGTAVSLLFTGSSAVNNDTGAALTTSTAFVPMTGLDVPYNNGYVVTIGAGVNEAAISMGGTVVPPVSYIPRDNDVLTMDFTVQCNS